MANAILNFHFDYLNPSLKEDCKDGSDEKDCRKLIQRQGYKKELTPVPKGGGNVSFDFKLYNQCYIVNLFFRLIFPHQLSFIIV